MNSKKKVLKRRHTVKRKQRSKRRTVRRSKRSKRRSKRRRKSMRGGDFQSDLFYENNKQDQTIVQTAVETVKDMGKTTVDAITNIGKKAVDTINGILTG